MVKLLNELDEEFYLFLLQIIRSRISRLFLLLSIFFVCLLISSSAMIISKAPPQITQHESSTIGLQPTSTILSPMSSTTSTNNTSGPPVDTDTRYLGELNFIVGVLGLTFTSLTTIIVALIKKNSTGTN